VTTALIVPQPRLDLLVDRAHDGARQRFTTYTGQIRCGTRTAVLGAQAWGSLAPFEHAWLLPDSLPYRADRIVTAQVTVAIAPMSINETFDVRQVSAALVADPDQVHAWLRFDFSLSTRTGSIGTYRIEVVTDPDAVAGPPGA
jgi:hypothetical protein